MRAQAFIRLPSGLSDLDPSSMARPSPNHDCSLTGPFCAAHIRDFPLHLRCESIIPGFQDLCEIQRGSSNSIVVCDRIAG